MKLRTQCHTHLRPIRLWEAHSAKVSGSDHLESSCGSHAPRRTGSANVSTLWCTPNIALSTSLMLLRSTTFFESCVWLTRAVRVSCSAMFRSLLRVRRNAVGACSTAIASAARASTLRTRTATVSVAAAAAAARRGLHSAPARRSQAVIDQMMPTSANPSLTVQPVSAYDQYAHMFRTDEGTRAPCAVFLAQALF